MKRGKFLKTLVKAVAVVVVVPVALAQSSTADAKIRPQRWTPIRVGEITYHFAVDPYEGSVGSKNIFKADEFGQTGYRLSAEHGSGVFLVKGVEKPVIRHKMVKFKALK